MFLSKKVSVLALSISVLVAFASAFAVFTFVQQQKNENVAPAGPKCIESMEQIRISNYELVHPLLLTDIPAQSESLFPIRNKIETYIAQAKSNQQVTDISVYFRRLNDGAWFCIDPNDEYNPASMSKIIYILVFLKEAESNSAVMNKKIFFAKHFEGGNKPNIGDFRLPENTSYTVRDLLTYMIKYSDNDAALLLSQNMNLTIYSRLFQDLNIPTPDPYKEYFMTVRDYAKFYRVLYSATYLNPDLAEYALKLLTLSDYDKGLKSGIDPTIQIAHKFGERVIGNKAQLHEFGIIFIKDHPYLIGVMSSGSSLEQLQQILSEISRISYSEYTNIYKNN